MVKIFIEKKPPSSLLPFFLVDEDEETRRPGRIRMRGRPPMDRGGAREIETAGSRRGGVLFRVRFRGSGEARGDRD